MKMIQRLNTQLTTFISLIQQNSQFTAAFDSNRPKV